MLFPASLSSLPAVFLVSPPLVSSGSPLSLFSVHSLALARPARLLPQRHPDDQPTAPMPSGRCPRYDNRISECADSRRDGFHTAFPIHRTTCPRPPDRAGARTPIGGSPHLKLCPT